MFACGDIVLVAFPFSEGSQGKRRPAVVLRKNDRYDDFQAVPVTSRPFHEHALPIEPAMLAKGSLPKASWVRLDKIATLHSDQVLGRIASLDPQHFAALLARVCGVLGCGTDTNPVPES